jgi:peroxiredoxin Q/BCP
MAKKAKVAKSTVYKSTVYNYKLCEGDKAPKFTGMATSGKKISLNDFRGRILVLYFYPKDSTPGCTLEGHDFSKLYSQFQKAGAEILGVSRDSLSSHEKFRSKRGFPFELLSDETGELCGAFDVVQMKNNYGRVYEGIERSTFVINASGKIVKEWRKVKVDGHVDDVLSAVKALK